LVGVRVRVRLRLRATSPHPHPYPHLHPHPNNPHPKPHLGRVLLTQVARHLLLQHTNLLGISVRQAALRLSLRPRQSQRRLLGRDLLVRVRVRVRVRVWVRVRVRVRARARARVRARFGVRVRVRVEPRCPGRMGEAARGAASEAASPRPCLQT
jgi:hypothetical protein